jgi:hypothetical protein
MNIPGSVWSHGRVHAENLHHAHEKTMQIAGVYLKMPRRRGKYAITIAPYSPRSLEPCDGNTGQGTLHQTLTKCRPLLGVSCCVGGFRGCNPGKVGHRKWAVPKNEAAQTTRNKKEVPN